MHRAPSCKSKDPWPCVFGLGAEYVFVFGHTGHGFGTSNNDAKLEDTRAPGTDLGLSRKCMSEDISCSVTYIVYQETLV